MSKRKGRTMYMHVLDGRPASLIRYTRGRVVMAPVAQRQRVPLLASLDAIRSEVNEVLDDACRVSKRDYPMSPREVHAAAADAAYAYAAAARRRFALRASEKLVELLDAAPIPEGPAA